MDKKTIVIIVLIVILALIIGYLIGTNTGTKEVVINNVAENKETEISIIGTYECDNWNGKKESIAIIDNENAIYMGYRATYTITDNKTGTKAVAIRYKTNSEYLDVTLTIVDNGLMNNSHLFKKI